jgi:hypothetical protein
MQKLQIYPYLVLRCVAAQGKGKSAEIADLPLPCAVNTFLQKFKISAERCTPFCRNIKLHKS